jgi:hypothetical protein
LCFSISHVVVSITEQVAMMTTCKGCCLDVSRTLRYNRDVLGRVRISVVAILVMALTVAPVVLNQCAASCQAHREAIASTPICPHHSAASNHGVRLQSVPSACGHDHNGTVVTAENGFELGRVLTTSAATLTTGTSSSALATAEAVSIHAPPDIEPSSAPHVSVLRI